MTAPSASDFLLGSGAKGKSASFLQIGASVNGTICREPEVKQQIDPDTQKLEFWDDGQPKWQIVVALQTDQRNPEIEGDDGVRFLYVKGSKKPESQSMHAAVAGAVATAGGKQLEVGGQLTVTYVGDGVKASAVRSAPKKYSAVYVPAAAAALGVPQAAPVAQPAPQYAPPVAVPQAYAVPQAAPAAPPVAAPVAAGPDPALRAAISHLSPEQQAAMLAVPGLTAEQVAAMYPAPVAS